MRVIDWPRLLEQRGVPFVERGPNVKKGDVNIRCPWCGAADPSHHMGLNLTTGWYSCWRNRAQHSGKSPVRLLMRLLSVSYEAARDLAGLGDGYVDPEGFDALAARLMGREALPPKVRTRRKVLEVDRHFVPIVDDRILTRRWWNYLYTRGFPDHDIAPMCEAYLLQACRGGHWDGRLVLPYIVAGELVSWTCRAIADTRWRYIDLSDEASVIPPKQTLYNHDAGLAGGGALVVVEGPMDALKLDWYGRPYGVRAVALSTSSATDEQSYQLEELASNFRRVGVMMDNKDGAGLPASMRVRDRLGAVPGIEALAVPAGRGDPGELSPGEVREFARQLTKGAA